MRSLPILLAISLILFIGGVYKFGLLITATALLSLAVLCALIIYIEIKKSNKITFLN